MVALDTNAVIHYFKGVGRVSERLLTTPIGDVGLPSVVVFELAVRALKSPKRSERQRQLGTLLEAIQILPFGQDEAAAAARIRADLEALGLPIGPLDVLIAGTALTRQATLVTRNTREFGRVEGLAVENWYD